MSMWDLMSLFDEQKLVYRNNKFLYFALGYIKFKLQRINTKINNLNIFYHQATNGKIYIFR